MLNQIGDQKIVFVRENANEIDLYKKNQEFFSKIMAMVDSSLEKSFEKLSKDICSVLTEKINPTVKTENKKVMQTKKKVKENKKTTSNG